MRRRLLTLACLCVTFGALPVAAQAKGPSAASVSGPGLSTPMSLSGVGEPTGGSGALGVLTMDGGFFATTFGGQTPDRRLPGKPAGDLGPRYVVDFTVPGPESAADHIRQDLYPYAFGGPVTFTPSGQRFFSGRRTAGGWYRGSDSLRQALVANGLPSSRPGSSTWIRWSDPAALAVLGAAFLLLCVASASLVRRAHPATGTRDMAVRHRR